MPDEFCRLLPPGFNKLTCLSLYGAHLHPLALQSLAGLPLLRSLDLQGLKQLEDSPYVGPVLASFASLQHLDLSYTSLGDQTVDCLTYSRRLAKWEQDLGAALPPLMLSLFA